MNEKLKKQILAQYKTITGERHAKQIANFLAWAVKHLPKEYLDNKEIARAIHGYKPGSKVGEDLEQVIINSRTKATVILREQYKLGYHSLRNVGIRATIDSNDTVEKTLKPAVSRAITSQQNVTKIAAIVDKEKCTVDNKKFLTTMKTSGLLSPSANADVIALLNE